MRVQIYVSFVTACGTPTTHYINTSVKLTIITHLSFSERIAIATPSFKPLYAIGSIPSLSCHAIAYRWRSRVRQHRASKPQGSSIRVLPWQVTMDQLIRASLSHAHYWYAVGMLRVSAM